MGRPSSVVGALLGGRRRSLAVVSGLSLLTASALTRFGVFEAGMESARDPRYTIEPQKRRPPRGRPSRPLDHHRLSKAYDANATEGAGNGGAIVGSPRRGPASVPRLEAGFVPADEPRGSPQAPHRRLP